MPGRCSRAQPAAKPGFKHENTRRPAPSRCAAVSCISSAASSSGQTAGVITATRGNHGQSIPFGAARVGIPVTVVVPHGNSRRKNAAMRALGAELVEVGHDFDAAREAAAPDRGPERGLDFIPSFGPDHSRRSAFPPTRMSCFAPAGALDAVYVPIGMGSGICGVIAARDMLGLKTKVVGVAAAGANAYALSFAAGKPVSTNAAETFADGMAVRIPNADAFHVIKHGAERIVTVSDDEIAEAVRLYFRAAHTIAEGAGAAPLAALLQERGRMKGKRVGLIPLRRQHRHAEVRGHSQGRDTAGLNTIRPSQ